MVDPSVAERGQVTHGVHTWEEEISSAGQSGEGRKSFVHFADRTLRHGEVQGAVLCSNDRVVFAAEFVESLVVDPHVLRELELANEVGADDECGDAAVNPVIGRTLR